MQGIKRLLRENKITFIYVAIATALEFVTSFFVGARPFFTQFWIPLLLVSVITLALFSIKSSKAKRITSFVLLILQVATIIASAYLYAANGSAFQKEMLYQRNDAFGTIEQFNLSIWLILLCLTALGGYLFIILSERRNMRALLTGITENEDNPPKRGLNNLRNLRLVSLCLCFICAAMFCVSPVLSGAAEKRQPNYYYKLNNSGDGNQKFGVTSNVLYELLRFSGSAGINLDDLDEAERFLFSEVSPTSDYHGISEDNNLLFILAESFDTHVLDRYSREDTAKIFPNISRIMDDGVCFDNFRQKEKTDVSEMFSLLGSYPTEKYINYSYEKNAYPYSLPKLFRDNANRVAESAGASAGAGAAGGLQIKSFHQNQGSFYNRDELHENLGFEELVSIEDMLEYGMVNDWDLPGRFTKGERSLDSLTASTMKNQIIPADKKFFSYWITFTMHGFYEERENLTAAGYYDVLDSHGLFPVGTKDENNWRTYAAAVMDFDAALGTILQDLEDKGKLDTTTIVIMPDHNTYYSSLSEYAKGLNNKLDTEGFRLPLMIFDNKLASAFSEKNQLPEGARRTVSKFVTGSDVMPTVCDLFGIKLWNNMFLGSTAFDDSRESIVYSRIYNFFFNDKLAFYSSDNIEFKAEGYTSADLEVFLTRAKTLLDKVYYMDKIYYSDYFSNHPYPLPQ